jgi:chromosome segregation ATPase
MSGWGLGASVGEGFAKLSNLAESAAQTAAAVKADAEAKLVASLNADDATGAARNAGRADGKDGEGVDFSGMPRKELEELCAKRSEKLKQAINKIKAQNQEYARIQRDYDQLQEIVRADAANPAAGDDPQLAQLRIDLKDAREHSAILKEQLAGKDAIIAELRQRGQPSSAEDGTLSTLNENDANGTSSCDGLRVELQAVKKKLEEAQAIAAAHVELQSEVQRLRAAQQELQNAKEEAEVNLLNKTEKFDELKAKSKEILAKSKAQKAEQDELRSAFFLPAACVFCK